MDILDSNEHLLQLTNDFVAESIRDQNPAGLCFSTSFPLLIYLATKQIKCNLQIGDVYKSNDPRTNRKITHYWLQLASEKIIIDPTYTQFIEEKKEAETYVGKIDNSEVKYMRSDLESGDWFNEAFDGWKAPFENPYYPIDSNFQRRNILYTLKLATILTHELKKTSLSSPSLDAHVAAYFSAVYRFIYNWYNGIINFDLNIEEIPGNFTDLISDALNGEIINRKTSNYGKQTRI